LYGGGKPENVEGDNYFVPAVCEVDQKNILFQEEIFGPVFPLIKFKNEEEALKIANDSSYGLAGSIISKDTERARKFAKELEVGAVFINSPVASDSRFPSGGVKGSGYGRECGVLGAREFTNEKFVWIK